jgi:predicted nucleic acid-binding protein
MIVLDTNVVSEPLKQAPNPAVVDWLNAQAPETLYLTTVNLAELLAGIELLPAGKRKTALKKALDAQILPLFEGRMLAFDVKAAATFAQINAKAQAAGSPLGFADGAIAAMALANGFAVATRNVGDFAHTGVKIINPWDI